MSYVYIEVNKKMIETIAENFGNLRKSRGKKQKFMGMDMEIFADVKLYLFMKYYI